MSIIKETVTVPERVQERQKALVCDLCGKVSPQPDRWSNYDGNVDEVIVEHRSGTNYGTDGGNVKEQKVDLCPDCFHTKLVPWLAEQGANLRTEEQGW